MVPPAGNIKEQRFVHTVYLCVCNSHNMQGLFCCPKLTDLCNGDCAVYDVGTECICVDRMGISFETINATYLFGLCPFS